MRSPSKFKLNSRNAKAVAALALPAIKTAGTASRRRSQNGKNSQHSQHLQHSQHSQHLQHLHAHRSSPKIRGGAHIDIACALIAPLVGILGWYGGFFAAESHATRLAKARTDASKMRAGLSWSYFVLNYACSASAPAGQCQDRTNYYEEPYRTTINGVLKTAATAQNPQEILSDAHTFLQGRAALRNRYEQIKAYEVAKPQSIAELEAKMQAAGQSGGTLSLLSSAAKTTLQGINAVGGALGTALLGTSSPAVQNLLKKTVDDTRYADDTLRLVELKFVAKLALDFLLGNCDSDCDNPPPYKGTWAEVWDRATGKTSVPVPSNEMLPEISS